MHNVTINEGHLVLSFVHCNAREVISEPRSSPTYMGESTLM